MVRAVRNLPENVRYPRKKGYAKRYVRSEFRKNRLQLLLGIVFLLGIVTGCSIAGQSGEAAGNAVITTLGQYLASAGTYGESGEFLSRMLSSFGATTLILFFLFLCGTVLLYRGLIWQNRKWMAFAGVCLGASVLTRLPNIVECALIIAVFYYGILKKKKAACQSLTSRKNIALFQMKSC